MSSVNKVIIVGNLGKDPEIRYTSAGKPIANLTVATSENWKDKNTGEKQEKTEWHKCVIWGSSKGDGLAGVVEKYVGKGDRLYVEGRVEYRQYEDKDKQTRYVTEVNVTDILLLGNKGGADSARSTAQPKGGSKKPDGFEEFPPAMDGDSEGS